MKYPVAKPKTKEEWISSRGPDVTKLEEEWAKYCGTDFAVACSSGTDALKLALAALKIGPGDEVIVPDFTMIATAWAVTYLGATPVFVDCGPDMTIDVSKIEAKITNKTKAIIPVHIYGRMCDMEKIMKIAYEYNLWVVEDAAEAHGAHIDGKKAGSWGHIGCFSLYANKIITAGEGGLITTNYEWFYKQLQHLKSMAFDENHTFLHKKLGYNNRMTNMQAKLAREQLGRIDEFIAKRKQIQEWYDVYLKDFTISRPEGSVLWMYDVLCMNRDEVMEHLKSVGVESRYFFKPMRAQPMYKEPVGVATFAEEVSMTGFYLPTYVDLTKEDVDFISTETLKVIKKYGQKKSS